MIASLQMLQAQLGMARRRRWAPFTAWVW